MILGFVPSNQRVFSPSIVDSNDATKIYPANANLVITRAEKYVNSGWMFPNGPLPGSSSTFNVTFQKGGTCTCVFTSEQLRLSNLINIRW